MNATLNVARPIARHVRDRFKQLRRDNRVFCVTTLVLTPLALLACAALLLFAAIHWGMLDWWPRALTEAQLLTAPLSWVLLALSVDCFARATTARRSTSRTLACCGAVGLVGLHLACTHLPNSVAWGSAQLYGFVLALLSLGAWLLLAVVYERTDDEALRWLTSIDPNPDLRSADDSAPLFEFFTVFAPVLGAFLESYATILNDTWRWRGVPRQLHKRCERIVRDLIEEDPRAALTQLQGLRRADRASILRILHEAGYVRLGGRFRLTDDARDELHRQLAGLHSA